MARVKATLQTTVFVSRIMVKMKCVEREKRSKNEWVGDGGRNKEGEAMEVKYLMCCNKSREHI